MENVRFLEKRTANEVVASLFPTPTTKRPDAILITETTCRVQDGKTAAIDANFSSEDTPQGWQY
jgi:hypothetical protein